MGRKCLRKRKLLNLLLRSRPQNNREKLEFITAIWTNKWEIKEFITAIIVIRKYCLETRVGYFYFLLFAEFKSKYYMTARSPCTEFQNVAKRRWRRT